MGLRERLLADYDHEIASTRRLLACVPADRLAWTPQAGCRTLAALAAHITHVVSWADAILADSSFDLAAAPAAPDPLTSCDAVVALFDATASRTRAALDRSDGELKALWCLKRDGSELFAMPREAAFRAFVLHHMIHHRGQLSICLRLAGVAVPAIYGPTG